MSGLVLTECLHSLLGFLLIRSTAYHAWSILQTLLLVRSFEMPARNWLFNGVVRTHILYAASVELQHMSSFLFLTFNTVPSLSWTLLALAQWIPTYWIMSLWPPKGNVVTIGLLWWTEGRDSSSADYITSPRELSMRPSNIAASLFSFSEHPSLQYDADNMSLYFLFRRVWPQYRLWDHWIIAFLFSQRSQGVCP